MAYEHGYGEGQTHHGIAVLLSHTDGDGHKDKGEHGLRLEDEREQQHAGGEHEVEHPERGLSRDAEVVEQGVDECSGQACRIETRSEGVSSGREKQQVPRNVDIVPFHHTDARQQSHHGSHEGHGRLVDAVLLVGSPKNEHDHEDGHRFPLIGAHLAQLVELLAQALHTTGNLRHTLFFLQGEEDFCSYEPGDEDEEHTHGKCHFKPVLVAERGGSQSSGNERSGQQCGSRTREEGIGAQVDLKQVLKYQVAPEVVAVLAARGSVDGCHDHEDGQEDGCLGRRGGDERREHQVDDDEAEHDTAGIAAELQYEP